MPDIIVNVQNQAVNVNLEDLSSKSGTLYLKDGIIHESKFSLGRSFLGFFSSQIRKENAAASRAIQQALSHTYDIKFSNFNSKLSGSDIKRLSDKAQAANLARCQKSIQNLIEKYGALAGPATDAVRQSQEFASGTVTHQMLENMNSAAELAKKQELQSIRADLYTVPAEGSAMSGPQLMTRLRAFPDLAALLDKDNTVGGSIGEHTLDVMRQMEDQKGFYNLAEVQTKIQDLPGFEHTNVEQFMKVVLAFHDIGKGLGNTLDQHEHTLPILQKNMKDMGFSEQEVRLASNLVGNDLLGEWQIGKKHNLSEVRSQLRALAQDSGIPMNAYIAMQKLFYISDASSYSHIQDAFMHKDSSGKLHFNSVDGTQQSNLERLLSGLEESIQTDVAARIQNFLVSPGAALAEGAYPISLFKDDFADKAYNIYDVSDGILASQAKIRSDIEAIPNEQADVRKLAMARLDQAVEMAAMATTMKADRWSPEHTRGIIEARLNIRAAGISDKIPKDLTKDYNLESVINGEFTGVDQLRVPGGVSDLFMELVDKQGGSSKLLNAVGQIQVASSWSPTSMAVKGYLEKNRAVDADAHFYHSQTDQQTTGTFDRKVSDQYDKFAHAPAEYWNELAEYINVEHNQLISVMLNAYSRTRDNSIPLRTPDTVMFDKSIQYQMAMQMELLSHMSFAGNDQERQEVVIYRTDSPALQKLNGFTAMERTRPMLRGSAESGSILYPVSLGGQFLTAQRVPYHRVINSFMLAGQHSGNDVKDTSRGAISTNDFREVLFMSDGLQSTALSNCGELIGKDQMGEMPLLTFN